MPLPRSLLLAPVVAVLLLVACGKSEEQKMREREDAQTKQWTSGTVDTRARHNYIIPTPPGEKPLFTNPADNPECIGFEKFLKAGHTLVPEDQAAYARDCAAKPK